MMKSYVTRTTFTSTIFMGLESSRHECRIFTKSEVVDYIRRVQDAYEFIVPLRYSETTFISGEAYSESGLEITAIDYPKLDITPMQIRAFMSMLTEKLVDRFEQKTICMQENGNTRMVRSKHD